MADKVYTHRYLARVVLSAETPLFIGSGETSLITDALVQKDIYGFPMIPGTSLTGVLRHALEDNNARKSKGTQLNWDSFFGYQSKSGKKGLGSQIKISCAYLVLKNGKVAEGLNPEEDTDVFLKYFQNLPVRQHVRITEKGVADTPKSGLFDNELVYRGGRFLFEIELKGTDSDKELWSEFLKALNSPLLRVGQGTRNGYGRLTVSAVNARIFNLQNENDFNDYLNYDPSLNANNNLNKIEISGEKAELIQYQLKLKPESFFIFSTGFGDEEVDNIPVTEEVLEYDNEKLNLSKPKGLIPASSIKGALRHRTAFHYNKIKNKYADKITDKKYLDFLGANNDAVYELFGAEEGVEDRGEKRSENYKELSGTRGKVIIDDIFLDGEKRDKIFNHVAIDRFTGGAMDGALFSEKVSYFDDENREIKINITVDKRDLDKDSLEIKAFEETLTDVCKGLLPLGGMTTKGHGIFTGKLFKNNNDKPEYDYETA